MSTIAGADGCPGGWVVATPGDGSVAWHVFATAGELFAWAGDAVLGIDIPIGLPSEGARGCDEAARRRLTGATSSVFSAPTRDRLRLGPFDADRYATVNAGLTSGPRFTRQLWGIMAKIAEVDAAVRDAGAGVHRRVFEVHPEVSFRALAPDTRFAGKKTARGVRQRLAALTAGLAVDVLASLDDDALARIPVDDALDALAVAWSARRWAHGAAEVLPSSEPPLDAERIPMRIVV